MAPVPAGACRRGRPARRDQPDRARRLRPPGPRALPPGPAEPAGAGEPAAPPGHWHGPVEHLAARVAAARDAGCDELVLDACFAPGSEDRSTWEGLVDLLRPLVEEAHRPAAGRG
ncbi:hypothetical protein [Nocardioides sp. TF02-7]|uniref:hypothetical protein n=1 Tax=Nocardioides sp. TF02-7 TaxID=2917724 RepID=UPI001F0599E4|nr:hypothetical protein [Nocardioides sp. TF02-7]UMG91308.1 hypothetical protein MF408_14165 [Nocardioides sp. TF02-7]